MDTTSPPPTTSAADWSGTAGPANGAGPSGAGPAGEPWAGPQGRRGEGTTAYGAGRRDLSWQFPPQEVVASYRTHDQANQAVYYLADHRFPIERTSIVGRGLTSVERITGRLTWRESFTRSLVAGGVAGALIGWIFGLLDWVNPLRTAFTLALWGLLFGAVLGAIVGLLTHALATSGSSRPGRVTAARGYQAESYDLMVDAELAEKARSILVVGGYPVTGAVRRDAVRGQSESLTEGLAAPPGTSSRSGGASPGPAGAAGSPEHPATRPGKRF
ncbi:MAG: hypothetical protein IRZ08_21730 [Frankia sp.]|nr:hypothetical protein [Frankia sp.]